MKDITETELRVLASPAAGWCDPGTGACQLVDTAAVTSTVAAADGDDDNHTNNDEEE
jgi:hypothetical protein